jgi:hypothetical protein
MTDTALITQSVVAGLVGEANNSVADLYKHLGLQLEDAHGGLEIVSQNIGDDSGKVVATSAVRIKVGGSFYKIPVANAPEGICHADCHSNCHSDSGEGPRE